MSVRDLVGQNLRRLRQREGWTQEGLAHQAGLDRNYVGMIERAENAATIDTLEKLAAVLQVDEMEFFRKGE